MRQSGCTSILCKIPRVENQAEWQLFLACFLIDIIGECWAQDACGTHIGMPRETLWPSFRTVLGYHQQFKKDYLRVHFCVNKLSTSTLKVVNIVVIFFGEVCLYCILGNLWLVIVLILQISVSVKAPSPPTITPFNVKTAVNEEERKVLTCLAKGSPKPNVTWYRDGNLLKTTDCRNDSKSCENILYEVYEEGDGSALHTTYTEVVLVIRKALCPRDDGEFKCVASNGYLPSAELTIDLDVQGMSRKCFVN